MAQKKKASRTKAAASKSDNVTRVRAVDTSEAKKPAKAKVAKTVAKAEIVADSKEAKPAKKRRISPRAALKPVKATGGYFKGAWTELKQVRWPTRRATWGMTGAVLLYTAFFVVLVLLLDAGFKYMFELILGK